MVRKQKLYDKNGWAWKTAKSTITISQAYLNAIFKCFWLNHCAVHVNCKGGYYIFVLFNSGIFREQWTKSEQLSYNPTLTHHAIFIHKMYIKFGYKLSFSI